jgi:hypothetical protein
VGDGLQATLLRACATPIAHRVGSYKYKKHGPCNLLRPGSTDSTPFSCGRLPASDGWPYTITGTQKHLGWRDSTQTTATGFPMMELVSEEQEPT